MTISIALDHYSNDFKDGISIIADSSVWSIVIVIVYMCTE